MAYERDKPYFWVTWLTPLLSGESDCEFKAWKKGHFSGLKKIEDKEFDQATWNANHTALITQIKKELGGRCEAILTEKQTNWKLVGNSGTTVAGQMDIITLNPNLVIDAKTGKRKNSHILQVQIYLIALEHKVVPFPPDAMPLSNKFMGLLRYGNRPLEVPEVTPGFRKQFYDLLKRLGNPIAAKATPSENECKYCDLAECPYRFEEKVRRPEAKPVEHF